VSCSIDSALWYCRGFNEKQPQIPRDARDDSFESMQHFGAGSIKRQRRQEGNALPPPVFEFLFFVRCTPLCAAAQPIDLAALEP
jgi:hypothetical protein